VAASTLVGAVLRFAGLGGQSFWLDETVTASLVGRSFSGMLDALPTSESSPPLYYVVAWLWTRVFGSDETGFRSLSAVAGTLTIPVAYAAAARLARPLVGLVTAALAALSPLLVWYSQEARAYALLVLFAALSFAFFAHVLERPSRSAVAGWAVASGLALLTHYFAAFLIAAEAVVLLVTGMPRRRLLAGSAGIAVVAAPLVPLTLRQAQGSSTWIRGVDLPLRAEETARQLVLPSPPPIWSSADVSERYLQWLWPLSLVVLGVALVVALTLGGARERRAVAVAFAVGSAVVLAPLAISVLGSVAAGSRGDYLLYRNAIIAWLPLTLVVATAATVQRLRGIGFAALALLALASCVVLVAMWTDERFQRDDWRGVAEAVEGPGRVIVLSPSWQVDALTYYVPGLVAIPDGGTPVDEIDLIVRRQAPSYTTLLREYTPPRAFRRASKERIQHWVVTRFRSRQSVHLTFEQLAPPKSGKSSYIILLAPG
jgi:mannosyltransferase